MLYVTAYARCVNDPVCAGKAVTGYMNKFAQVNPCYLLLIELSSTV